MNWYDHHFKFICTWIHTYEIMNSYKLWIHMIFSYMNLYMNSGYRGSRSTFSALWACRTLLAHGPGTTWTWISFVTSSVILVSCLLHQQTIYIALGVKLFHCSHGKSNRDRYQQNILCESPGPWLRRPVPYPDAEAVTRPGPGPGLESCDGRGPG